VLDAAVQLAALYLAFAIAGIQAGQHEINEGAALLGAEFIEQPASPPSGLLLPMLGNKTFAARRDYNTGTTVE
jgi:hypothetical protein